MKRIATLLLAVLMLAALLAGCTGGNTNGGETTATPAASSGSTGSTGTESNSQNTQTEEPSTENESIYPLVTDGSVTLSLCMPMPGEAAPVMTSLIDDGINLVWPELIKRTGINIDMITFPDYSYNEQANILIAGGDLPDIYRANYPGGVQKLYEDGLAIRLNEYEDIMPGYMRWVNLNDVNRKAAYTDAGNLIGISQVYSRLESGWAGYYVRTDWLEDLGMEKPTTIDEWTAVLKAFKENKSTGAPMDFVGNGLAFSNYFNGAYNVASGGIVNQNGTLSYSYLSEGMYEYLKQMNEWYAAGYIYPDYVNNSAWNFYPDTNKIGDNTFGAIHLIMTAAGSYYADSGVAEAGCFFGITQWPTLEKNGDRKVNFKGYDSATLGDNGWLISPDCATPEYAIRFLDYAYTEEGQLLTNWGLEGVSFVYGADGKPQFTDLIMNNPDYQSSDCMRIYLIHTNFILDVDRSEASMSPAALEYNEYWNEPGEWNFSANVSYTTEESARRAAIQADLDTYNNEMINKFITGVEPLTEENFQNYVTRLKGMGVDEFVQITQAAYERWLAK